MFNLYKYYLQLPVYYGSKMQSFQQHYGPKKKREPAYNYIVYYTKSFLPNSFKISQILCR